MAYGQTEPQFGFKQLSGQAKATGAGTGSSYGDTLYYDRATDNWKKAIAGAVKPFGFNGMTKMLTQTLDMISGQTTYTRGATAPVTKVMAWNGTEADAVVGRYVRNITQHHNYDTLPAAALNDAILIDVEDQMAVGP